jgi:hypothetical protein
VTNIRLRWISPKAISNLFLASDILCLLIQSSGAAIITSSYDLGIKLLLAGLALQLGFFALFIILSLHANRIYTANLAKAMQRCGRSGVRTARLQTLALWPCSGCCTAPWPCWASGTSTGLPSLFN